MNFSMATRRRIIPSITTHSLTGHTWRDKITEIEQLGLKQVGLFLTGLSEVERYECFCELEFLASHHLFSIPFVHAVSTMKEDEYRFLVDTFDTEWFNLHPMWEYPLKYPLSDEIRSRILIENSQFEFALRTQDVEGFAGLCLDLSHLEDSRRSRPEVFDANVGLSHTASVTANHISAVIKTPRKVQANLLAYSSHTASEPEDFSYLSGLPSITVAPLCALELENSLAEQVALMPFIRFALEAEQTSLRSVA